ncbi:FAD/NAD(P)-binding protein [Hymenobacter jeollabukensis]|uniref:FAD-dependent oxidoreductase n=1 Tax=Hymenobacter jeollabukensis TaxID=2025313 RepID=A0A5R8WLM8_9BACT|nr:FAD-dependent oxidoreductase [Hymenobacter jeollabukensis]TLM90133.1 FAD-dependent oxidoreductase [Hymenobacter jeollabukensis]
MTRRSIVIIGGGVAGSLLALQLTRLPGGPWPLDVTVVEPRPRLGPGTAYGTDRPEWLLNVRSPALSALPDEPNHFVDWLQRRGIADCAFGFCSRQTYGRYIESLLEPALAAPAANGVRLQWLNDRATAAQPHAVGAHALRVQLAGGTALDAHTVVLALGNFAPALPVRPATGYQQHPRFHANPWQPGALRGIGPAESVLLIGTGLTALDVLVALRADGHRGPLLAASRHGQWPAAHTPAPVAPYPSYYATHVAGRRTVSEVVHAVRQQIAKAEAEGYNWRAVLDALRPDLGRIWATWPVEEQQRFLRHLATRWGNWRHRNPPQNAAVLDELLASGRLQVHHGRVRAIEPRGDAQLAVRLTRHYVSTELTADHVVLCTGPQLDYAQLNEPLVVSLRQAGLLLSDALHLGLATSPEGALLDAAGAASECLFTLGPSLRPQWYESTAVPELRQQAAHLAAVLAQRHGAAIGHPGALQLAP